jgi:hypothetical protein
MENYNAQPEIAPLRSQPQIAVHTSESRPTGYGSTAQDEDNALQQHATNEAVESRYVVSHQISKIKPNREVAHV